MKAKRVWRLHFVFESLTSSTCRGPRVHSFKHRKPRQRRQMPSHLGRCIDLAKGSSSRLLEPIQREIHFVTFKEDQIQLTNKNGARCRHFSEDEIFDNQRFSLTRRTLSKLCQTLWHFRRNYFNWLFLWIVGSSFFISRLQIKMRPFLRLEHRIHLFSRYWIHYNFITKISYWVI